MKTNHVEISVTCRVNGILVVNTHSHSYGDHPKEAVEIALKSASIINEYQHSLETKGRMQRTLEITERVSA